MRSTAPALAVVAAMTAPVSAHAQAVSTAPTSVQIYGVVDMGVVHQSGGTNPVHWLTDNYHTSRLGFRGVEDLGDGLTAIFKLESRFLPKTGASQDTSTFFNDEAYVGLSKPTLGTLRLGRVYSSFYLAVAGRIDPFNGDGIGSMTGLSSLEHNLSPGNPYDAAKGTYNRDVRTNDAIDYTSPVVGGFTLQLQTALPGNGARQKAVVVKYDSQTFFAETGYEKKSYSTKAYTAHVGGGATFGPVRLSTGYAWGYYSDDEAARDNRARSLLVGVTYTTPWTGLNLLAAVARLRNDEPTLLDAARGTGSSVTKAAIGAEYYFSKRTKVYAHYAHTNALLSTLFISTRSKEMIGIDHRF